MCRTQRGVGVIGAIDEELRSQVLGRVTDERSGWQTVGRSSCVDAC